MSRLRVIVVLAVVAGTLGWVAARGLSENLVYYSTPTEVLGGVGGAVGERIRLGGYVMPGSVQEEGDEVRFIVTDGTTRVSVVGTGGVPSLFREGQGVVVEGAMGSDGRFHADTVLVKHGSEYRPPAPGETPHQADLDEG